jgi:outer membrane protein W
MNYKKIKLAALIVGTFLNTHTQAQKLFATINGGYGIATGASNAGSDAFLFTDNGNTVTAETVNTGLAKGINFGVGIGNMFTKNIGVELGLNYLIGEDIVTGETSAPTFNSEKTHANLINIKPSFILQVPLNEINVYCKFGLQISQGNIYSSNEDKSNVSLDVIKLKTSGGIGTGFTGGIGASYLIAKRINVFVEINNTNANFAPNKAVIYEATSNGVDILPFLSTSEKEVQYLDKVTIQSTTQPDPNKPGQTFKPYFSTGNTGINIGVKYDF